MKNEKHLFPLNLQFFAGDGDPAPKDPEPKDDPIDEPQEPTPEPSDDKKFTQAEIDEIVAKRLERERKKFSDYDDLKTKLTEFEKAEEERKKAAMTEQERLQAEKEEALLKAQEAEEAKQKALEIVNQRLINTEIRSLARELGVRSDALDDVSLLADLSAVTVDDEGNVIGAKEALEALKDKKAYLFGTTGGADPSPGNPPAKRDAQESLRQRIREAEEKALKTGRPDDRVEAMKLRAQLEEK